MPRPSYPSDHRRWFRVYEDILTDPGYRSMRAGDRAVWIDLLAHFNLRQAHRTANTVIFAWSDAMLVLGGSQHRRAAVVRASRLRRGVGVTWARVPEGLLCHIPNYAKMQGLTPSGLPPRSAATPCTTTTPTPTPTPTKRKRGTTSPRPAGASVFPDPFPPEHLERLVAWAQGDGLSEARIIRAVEVVRDWALSKGEKKSDWVATIRGAIRKGWALDGGAVSAEEEIPRGQAYAPQDHPRELARKAERRREELQVESETEERERRFGKPSPAKATGWKRHPTTQARF